MEKPGSEVRRGGKLQGQTPTVYRGNTQAFRGHEASNSRVERSGGTEEWKEAAGGRWWSRRKKNEGCEGEMKEENRLKEEDKGRVERKIKKNERVERRRRNVKRRRRKNGSKGRLERERKK